MPKSIPFDPKASADQSLKVDVGGFVVMLRAMWNTREQAWYLDAVTPFGSAPSAKVIPYSPIFGNGGTFAGNGNFHAVKNDSQAPDSIGYGDLGNSWALVWISSEELNGV